MPQCKSAHAFRCGRQPTGCRGYPFWICPAISDKGTLDNSVNDNAAMRQ
jgi:hypothetical protein